MIKQGKKSAISFIMENQNSLDVLLDITSKLFTTDFSILKPFIR